MRRLSPIVARLIIAAGLAASLFGALSARAGGDVAIYLPMVSGSGQAAPGGPRGSLPAELAGTWYSGALLNLDYYNRQTGTWTSSGGLGHMYVLGADGTYTLVSKLEIGGGTTCVSSVSKYHTGAARVEGGELVLTPSYARTRTVTCGSVVSDTEGPYGATRIPWRTGEDPARHTRLWLTEVQGETEYYRDGMPPQVIGSWASGDGGAVQLYDVASGAWADPTGENSQWFELNADGSYRRGRVDAGFGDDPCRTVTMTYEEGALAGSGGLLNLQPAGALRRQVSLCDPWDAFEEELAAGEQQRWSWGFQNDGVTLQLMRVSAGFEQVFLSQVE